MAAVILNTERLSLREFTPLDSSFVRELVNSPGWLQFIGDRKIYSDDDAYRYIDTLIQGYAANGFGLWRVSLKVSDEPVGMCGLVRRDYLPHVDIGFALLPEWTGQGMGYEIARATLRHATDVVGLSTVLAITDATNDASIALLNKLGLQFEEIIESPEGSALLMFTSQRPTDEPEVEKTGSTGIN